MLIGLAVLIVLALVVGIGGYFYMDNKLQAIPRERVSALTAQQAGQPIDILLVGSDSRAFVATPGQAQSFGSAATQTGQRADTIVVVRLLPGGKITMLSIPRDTWVPIAGTGGSSRINSAFNAGPNDLVKSIQDDFHIPINHVFLTTFPGFSGMVDSLGGIYLNFRDPVRDAYTGLDVTHTGCQLVNGTVALSLVRSRHLYYYSHHEWQYDGLSDFSRIKRQQAFFHALIKRVHSAFPDIFRLNSFVSATVKNLHTDMTFSSGELIRLGCDYHSLSPKNLSTVVLPTTPTVIAGQDVLLPAQPDDRQAIASFLASGSSGGKSSAAPAVPQSRPTLMQSGVVTGNFNEPWNPVPC
ncbi:MAG: LCP family protein [Acidimicrobiales bacterium]